jgi:hypothetical protein
VVAAMGQTRMGEVPMSSWRRVNQQKYGSDAFLEKSRELRDELAPTHKAMADMAEKYAALKEAEAQIKKQLEEMRKELVRWVELNGPQHVEGVGTLKLQNRRNDEIDVAALAKGAPHLFQELLSRAILSVNKTRLSANKDLTGFGPYTTSGTSPALIIEKERH